MIVQASVNIQNDDGGEVSFSRTGDIVRITVTGRDMDQAIVHVTVQEFRSATALISNAPSQ